ncbi:MAG: D-inositol-3-phosphate glycosyltransferase [Candidatus Nanopelagicales bacterium]|nr:D-inositol-3-phosphate glycosyltransferase [Candidatus Nanopelagicales bacterium]
MLSLHTSPLDQPGVGDAGGLNVYVLELACRLAAADVDVEIFTRGSGSMELSDTSTQKAVDVCPGVRVVHLGSPVPGHTTKEELPAQLCAFAAGLLRTELTRGGDYFDLVHSHYWLSGQVGAVVSDHWGVPLVHSMHTMALVKNRRLATDDKPEPHLRILGEQQVVAAADHLIANTTDEAEDLIDLYQADPRLVDVVHPGVDLDVFTPGDQMWARQRLGVGADESLLLFVGRIQPLKGPDLFVHTVAELLTRAGQRDRPLTAVVCGGPSGAGPDRVDELRSLAARLGVSDRIRFEPPTGRFQLADWYRAADIVCVPSYSESFGLVAIEAQACGRPVVAAAVGGLNTSVADGESGILIDSHEPTAWAEVLAELLRDHEARRLMGQRARAHAERFGWSSTAAGTLNIYRRAINRHSRARGRDDRTG